MSDRHLLPRIRRRHRASKTEGLTAAAKILRPTRADEPKPEPWHAEAWGFRDTIGELRFAETWLSNNFSRSRLFAARRPEPGKEPEPVDDGPAYEALCRLAGGPGGQAALMRSMGTFMMIPGEAYLVGEAYGHAEKYSVVNSEDIRLARGNDEGYEIRVDESSTLGWRPLPEGSLVTRIYRPHPRHRWEPDSPTRAALPILRELSLLTQHVEATATSRLAGAGVQPFPMEAEFEHGWEAFVEEYIEALSAPVHDRSLASALVPFPVRMPGEFMQAFKDAFMSYSTPFDEHALALRQEGILRLGNAMDMPRQALTGESSNHWGDWQVEESGLKIHVEPGLETIVDGFTVGFLIPWLEAAAEGSPAAAKDIERRMEATPNGEWIVWYDTADLKVRPDRSGAVRDAYDRFEASGKDLRNEQGGSEWTPADPNDPVTQRRIWFKMLEMERTAPLALKKLGMIEEGELLDHPLPATAPSTVVQEMAEEGLVDEVASGGAKVGSESGGEPDDEGPEVGGRGLPGTGAPNPSEQRDTPSAPAGPSSPPSPSSSSMAPAIALVAALDGLVYRAMERAGRRALNKMPRSNGNKLARTVNGEECPAERLHTCTQLDSYLPIEKLFDGAWDRLPEIADQLDEDADVLESTLNAYVRVLVLSKAEHSWEGLARALGIATADDEEEATT